MPYFSRVISGKGRGRGLGFPTLNLIIPDNFQEKEGIYAARVIIGSKVYLGALHWGPIPVFDQNEPALEIFLLDYDEAEQPEALSFELKKYLRPIQNFANPTELTKQIERDIAVIRGLFSRQH